MTTQKDSDISSSAHVTETRDTHPILVHILKTGLDYQTSVYTALIKRNNQIGNRPTSGDVNAASETCRVI